MNDTSIATAGMKIRIQLATPEPWTHYVDVVISIIENQRRELDFVMPVWTPGSYLVREFSRNVVAFSARDVAGKSLHWEKVNKNTWRVHTESASALEVSYRVYAFELSVRTSFVDDSHAFINGAATFMYVDGFQGNQHLLAIKPYPGWESVSTGLDPVAGEPFRFSAPDYDTLIDCPVEIGNQQILSFSIREVPHFVSIYGTGNQNPGRICADIQKIVETALAIFADIPYRHYTFMLQLVPEGRGGLEHANSMSIQINRWAFEPKDSYDRFLDLLAHEYFHVWNVKRLRPIELGPFNYSAENYTRLLWVSEGFTDYYSSQITLRAGIIDRRQYLAGVAKAIGELEDTPGRLVESAADASFDAWIKFYRQDPNSPNATISYYLKGGLIALVLDLEIRKRTGDKSLDDVMCLLYEEYYKKSQRGFTEEEFRLACEQIAGGPLQEIFDNYCYGTSEIDFDRYLAHAGLRLAGRPEGTGGGSGSYLGISARTVEGRVSIVGITAGSPAHQQGLNLNDEVIAINGFRVDQEILTSLIKGSPPGSVIDLLIARQGRLREFRIVLGAKNAADRKIERLVGATPEQKQIHDSWLRTKWDDGNGGSVSEPEGKPD